MRRFFSTRSRHTPRESRQVLYLQASGQSRVAGRDLSYNFSHKADVYCETEYGCRDSMRALFTKLSRMLGRREQPTCSAPSAARFESTDTEAEAYALRLQECAAGWKTAPGLLLDVSGAGIAAIVRFREATYDRLGFRLVIEVEEPMVVPEGLRKNDTVELAGNWKYGSFDKEGVSVLDCYSIYFGEEGVERVLRFWTALPTGKIKRPAPRPFFSMLRQCFHAGRPGWISEEEYQKRLKMFARKSEEPGSA